MTQGQSPADGRWSRVHLHDDLYTLGPLLFLSLLFLQVQVSLFLSAQFAKYDLLSLHVVLIRKEIICQLAILIFIFILRKTGLVQPCLREKAFLLPVSLTHVKWIIDQFDYIPRNISSTCIDSRMQSFFAACSNASPKQIKKSSISFFILGLDLVHIHFLHCPKPYWALPWGYCWLLGCIFWEKILNKFSLRTKSRNSIRWLLSTRTCWIVLVSYDLEIVQYNVSSLRL